MSGIKPYLVRKSPDPEKEIFQSEEERKRIDQFVNCILCACCYGACEVLRRTPEYMGPAALAKLQRFMLDSRDERPDAFLASVDSSAGVWGCDTLFRCIDACPKEVRPTDAIVGLRKRLVKYRLKRAFGVRSVKIDYSLVTRRTFLNTLIGGWLASSPRQLLRPLPVCLPDPGKGAGFRYPQSRRFPGHTRQFDEALRLGRKGRPLLQEGGHAGWWRSRASARTWSAISSINRRTGSFTAPVTRAGTMRKAGTWQGPPPETPRIL